MLFKIVHLCKLLFVKTYSPKPDIYNLPFWHILIFNTMLHNYTGRNIKGLNMKKLTSKLFGLFCGLILLTACNGGLRSQQEQNILAKTSINKATINDLIVAEAKYRAISVTDIRIPEGSQQEAVSILVAHENGVSIGDVALQNPQLVNWHRPAFSLRNDDGANDIKVCPVLSRLFAVAVGNHGAVSILYSPHKEGAYTLNEIKQLVIPGNSKINWTSVSCAENPEDGYLYIALAGYLEDTYKAYATGYVVARETIYSDTPIQSGDLHILGSNKMLPQVSDTKDLAEHTHAFFKVNYVINKADDGHPTIGLFYSTHKGLLYANSPSIVGLMSSKNYINISDSLYVAIPVLAPMSTVDDLTLFNTTNEPPIIYITSIGDGRVYDSFHIMIDAWKVQNTQLIEGFTARALVLRDPLGRDETNREQQLEATVSDATCNVKGGVCMFTLRNNDVSHSQSSIYIFNRKTLQLISSSSQPPGSELGEDKFITGLSTVPDVSGAFISLGSNGSLYMRKCSSTGCTATIKMTSVYPKL